MERTFGTQLERVPSSSLSQEKTQTLRHYYWERFLSCRNIGCHLKFHYRYLVQNLLPTSRRFCDFLPSPLHPFMSPRQTIIYRLNGTLIKLPWTLSYVCLVTRAERPGRFSTGGKTVWWNHPRVNENETPGTLVWQTRRHLHEITKNGESTIQKNQTLRETEELRSLLNERERSKLMSWDRRLWSEQLRSSGDR